MGTKRIWFQIEYITSTSKEPKFKYTYILAIILRIILASNKALTRSSHKEKQM